MAGRPFAGWERAFKDASEGSDEKDSRAGCRIEYAEEFSERSHSVGFVEHVINQKRRCVERTIVGSSWSSDSSERNSS